MDGSPKAHSLGTEFCRRGSLLTRYSQAELDERVGVRPGGIDEAIKARQKCVARYRAHLAASNTPQPDEPSL